MSGRVVGKDASPPGCNDILFAGLFVAHVILIIALFFVWVSDGATGFPYNQTAALIAEAQATGVPLNITNLTDVDGLMAQTDSTVQATINTWGITLGLTTLWVFIFLAILKVAALTLIVTINLLLLAVWAGTGVALLYHAESCHLRTAWPGPCTDQEYATSYAGAIVLFAICALHALWLCCIRKRIALTARMLKAVSLVLFACPGTIMISYVMALASIVWYGLWGGAMVQGAVMMAGSHDTNLSSGQYVGLVFGMFLSLYWTLGVLRNISKMAACHVTASWYFDPEVINQGSPFCRPVTLVGLKRASINYLGSIAFGSFIVAILESIYATVQYFLSRLGDGNLALKLVVSCLLCILNCLKRTIEWLTEWAYVYIAIYGVNFISAGGKVASMLSNSGMGAFAQLSLVGPVLTLGKLLGAAVGVGAGLVTLQSYTIENDWSQPLVGGFLGYSLTSVALACVDAGNKTMYVCYVDAPEFMAARSPGMATEFSEVKPPESKGSTDGAPPGNVELVRP